MTKQDFNIFQQFYHLIFQSKFDKPSYFRDAQFYSPGSTEAAAREPPREYSSLPA